MTAPNLTIIKCARWCCDGGQYEFCPYMEITGAGVTQLTWCRLFDVQLMQPTQALEMCNKLYGDTYHGKP